MKKLISVVTVVVMTMSCTTAQAQPGYERNQDHNNDYAQQSFDYYPSANVYFDNSCNRYIYNNGRSWLSVNFLPFGFSIGNSPRYQVYSNYGSEIWRDNDMHRSKYCRHDNDYRNNDRDYRDNDRDYRNNDRGDWRRDRHRHWNRGRGYDRRYYN